MTRRHREKKSCSASPGSIWLSGCLHLWKFISRSAEGHDMLHKHDTLSKHLLRESKRVSRCVAPSVFLFILLPLCAEITVLADEDKASSAGGRMLHCRHLICSHEAVFPCISTTTFIGKWIIACTKTKAMKPHGEMTGSRFYGRITE